MWNGRRISSPVSSSPPPGHSDVHPPSDVRRAVDLVQERKALDVAVLDLRGRSAATDYFLLGSGASDVQVRAIADHLIEELKAGGLRPSHVEGLKEGRWVLVDYIDFVVHVFHSSVRDFYQLETLWGDAPRRIYGEESSPDG